VMTVVATPLTFAFVPPNTRCKVQRRQQVSSIYAEENKQGSINIPNPFAEIADMFSNFDDVVDDFFNKRMGNGEVFYGKRKYKPSGSVQSDYEGYGFSDRRKIDAAREFRAERQRMREMAAAEKKNLQ